MRIDCARCEREISPQDERCPYCGFHPAQDSARFGPFRLVERLGRGGLAVVFRAVRDGMEVALKILESTQPDIVAQFRREAEVASALSHPNLVQVFDAGEADGHGYLSMELVGGPSLAEAIRRRLFTVADYVLMLAQVARALHHAHRRGVVHRDITPGNILLSADRTAKLTDFGQAIRIDENVRLAPGVASGTPVFMSPEQAVALHDMVDARADVYSLGAVLYNAVTGRPPFSGTQSLEILRRVQTEDPLMPSELDPAMAAILRRAMDKDPNGRFPTMNEFATVLERWPADSAGGNRRPS